MNSKYYEHSSRASVRYSHVGNGLYDVSIYDIKLNRKHDLEGIDRGTLDKVLDDPISLYTVFTGLVMGECSESPKTIEYKHSEDISVFFTPIEDGLCHYTVEVHNFAELEMWREIMNYTELEQTLECPEVYFVGVV